MSLGNIYEDSPEVSEAREDYFRIRISAKINTSLVGQCGTVVE